MPKWYEWNRYNVPQYPLNSPGSEDALGRFIWGLGRMQESYSCKWHHITINFFPAHPSHPSLSNHSFHPTPSHLSHLILPIHQSHSVHSCPFNQSCSICPGNRDKGKGNGAGLPWESQSHWFADQYGNLTHTLLVHTHDYSQWSCRTLLSIINLNNE